MTARLVVEMTEAQRKGACGAIALRIHAADDSAPVGLELRTLEAARAALQAGRRRREVVADSFRLRKTEKLALDQAARLRDARELLERAAGALRLRLSTETEDEIEQHPALRRESTLEDAIRRFLEKRTPEQVAFDAAGPDKS